MITSSLFFFLVRLTKRAARGVNRDLHVGPTLLGISNL